MNSTLSNPERNLLEGVLLEGLEQTPDLAKRLERDFDFFEENTFVRSLVKILVDRNFDDQTLLGAQHRGYMKSPEALALSSCEDFVLQAVLSSPATPSHVLDSMLASKPDWLRGGWWCIQRLSENPNTSSRLLLEALRNIDVEDLDDDIVEAILEHPNVTHEISDILDG
jgi:hypothetical protein